MENHPQFNLNESLCGWRDELSQSPAIRGEDIAELEVHLRDSIATLQSKGLTEEEAFFIAARRLGGAESLECEFGKVNSANVWLSRALWMVIGFMGYYIGMNLAAIASYASVFIISYFAAESGTVVIEENLYRFSSSQINNIVLGWFSVGVRVLTLTMLAWLGYRLVRYKSARVQAWISRCAEHPLAAAVVLIAMFVGLQAAVFTAPVVLARTMSSTAYAVNWGTWLSVAILPLLLIGLVITLAVLHRKKVRSGGLGMLFVPVVACLLVSGCGQSTQTKAPKSEAPAAKGEQTSLEQSLALWTAGDKTVAAEKFLQVDWTKGKPFSTGSILAYSEAEFIALPQDARTKLNESKSADIAVLRQLCDQVKQMGQAAAAKGDKAKATKSFNALNQCGEALDQPSRLALLQMVGKALKKLAAKELAAMP